MSNELTTIRVGGVPEHFNYPWHYALKHGIFEKNGLRVVWEDVKGGSGAMCSMLSNGSLDVALVLTEGITKHIHQGGTSRIIQQYVKSPLIWGVHSQMNRTFSSADLSQARIARSRVGSGSHLMAYVHAEEKGYNISEKNFVTVKNIDGAEAAFLDDEADILLWEKFMTQPYVDSGKMNRIGQCASPWPCFMMVGSGTFIQNRDIVNALSLAILQACKEVSASADTISYIAQMYGLKPSQVEKWYATVEWQTSPWLSKKMLQNVITTLQRVSILGATPLAPNKLCYEGAQLY